MKIQFLRNHLLFKEGQTIDTFAPGFCQVLIDRGIAKPVLEGVPNKQIAEPDDGKATPFEDAIQTKPARAKKHK